MSTSPIKKGITTITWGSDSMTQGGIATAIVESISYRDVPVDAEIETNVGTAATLVIVDNGFDSEAKCLYDSAITWPVIGDQISLKSPRFGSTKKACIVVAITEDVGRKKEAMISFSLKHRPDLGLTAV